VTLVFQGLSLIPLLRFLRVDAGEETEQREIDVRVHALQAGLRRLGEIETGDHLPEEWVVIGRIKSEYEHRIDHLQSHRAGTRESPASIFDHRLQDEALLAERDAIMRLRAEGKIPDEIFRRIEYDLDLAETRLR
jgi:hypothetical protein